MKIANSLCAEAFLYPTEDRNKVLKALDFVVPGMEPRDEAVESYHGPAIVRLACGTESDSEIKKFFKKASTGLSESDRGDLRRNLRHHIDEHGCLYLRFDKQKAFAGELVLAYKGDVIKVKIKMASYPFSVETVQKTVEGILNET